VRLTEPHLSTGVGDLWKPCSLAAAARGAAQAPQACPERPFQLALRIVFRIACVSGDRDSRLRVPELDMQCLDFLNQEHDRFAGRADLLVLFGREPCAPPPQLIKLVFVESSVQDFLPAPVLHTITFLPFCVYEPAPILQRRSPAPWLAQLSASTIPSRASIGAIPSAPARSSARCSLSSSQRSS